MRPFPITDLRHIVAVFTDVLPVLDKLAAQKLLEVSSDALQTRNAIDDVACKVETIQIVQDSHVERSCCRAFFFVAANVEIVVVRAAIGEAVDQPGVTMKRKNDWLVFRE